MKRFRIFYIISLIALLSACSFGGSVMSGSGIKTTSRDVFAMDTYMTITCCGAKADMALDAAEAEIVRLDNLLSVGNPESEIYKINASGSGTLSEDSRSMLEMSMELYTGTDGAFDITVYPLMEAWGFTSNDARVPTAEEIRSLLADIGTDKLNYDTSSGEVTLGDGQGIDFGGIAKGYTSDRLTELFREYGLTYGVISLGGNVQFYGQKADGAKWRCGITDPFAPYTDSMLAVLTVDDVAVVTSGGYERYFTDSSGNTYHHIIDTKTGFPADSGIISATIVSHSGTLADGLSTACYVMGLERASEFWRTRSGDFDMVLVTDSGDVYVTDGLVGTIETEYPLYIIEK